MSRTAQLGPQDGADTVDLDSYSEGRVPADIPDAGGPTGPTTRSFEHSWVPSGGVDTPDGPRNPGHVHNVVSTNGQWSRGKLPEMGYGYAFALRRPRLMREPRTDLGSYNFAKG